MIKRRRNQVTKKTSNKDAERVFYRIAFHHKEVGAPNWLIRARLEEIGIIISENIFHHRYAKVSEYYENHASEEPFFSDREVIELSGFSWLITKHPTWLKQSPWFQTVLNTSTGPPHLISTGRPHLIKAWLCADDKGWLKEHLLVNETKATPHADWLELLEKVKRAEDHSSFRDSPPHQAEWSWNCSILGVSWSNIASNLSAKIGKTVKATTLQYWCRNKFGLSELSDEDFAQITEALRKQKWQEIAEDRNAPVDRIKHLYHVKQQELIMSGALQETGSQIPTWLSLNLKLFRSERFQKLDYCLLCILRARGFRWMTIKQILHDESTSTSIQDYFRRLQVRFGLFPQTREKSCLLPNDFQSPPTCQASDSDESGDDQPRRKKRAAGDRRGGTGDTFATDQRDRLASPSFTGFEFSVAPGPSDEAVTTEERSSPLQPHGRYSGYTGAEDPSALCDEYSPHQTCDVSELEEVIRQQRRTIDHLTKKADECDRVVGTVVTKLGQDPDYRTYRAIQEAKSRKVKWEKMAHEVNEVNKVKEQSDKFTKAQLRLLSTKYEKVDEFLQSMLSVVDSNVSSNDSSTKQLIPRFKREIVQVFRKNRMSTREMSIRFAEAGFEISASHLDYELKRNSQYYNTPDRGHLFYTSRELLEQPRYAWWREEPRSSWFQEVCSPAVEPLDIDSGSPEKAWLNRVEQDWLRDYMVLNEPKISTDWTKIIKQLITLHAQIGKLSSTRKGYPDESMRTLVTVYRDDLKFSLDKIKTVLKNKLGCKVGNSTIRKWYRKTPQDKDDMMEASVDPINNSSP